MGHQPVLSHPDARVHRLPQGVTLVGVDPDALGVAHEHVDHPVSVADAGDIIVKGEWLGGGQNLDIGPLVSSGGVGAPLLVWPTDENDRSRVDAVLVQQPPSQLDVVPGVRGFRLDQDGRVRDVEAEGVLTVVDGLAAGEPFDRGRGVGASEDDAREQSSVVELSYVSGDAEVVAAETDPDVDGVQLVAEVVVLPQCLNVVADLHRQPGGIGGRRRGGHASTLAGQSGTGKS